MSTSVTAVVCGRNDARDMPIRAAYCLNSMAATFDELIFVDWASQGVDMATAAGPMLDCKGKLRLFTIQPKQAKRWLPDHWDPTRFCEVLARNLGIRRAQSDFIVSTNADIVVGTRKGFDECDPLWSEETFTTVARRDIDQSWLPSHNDSEAVQRQIDENGHTVSPRGPGALSKDDDTSLVQCCGDFQWAHRRIWFEIRGFEEALIGRLYADSNVQAKAATSGFQVASSTEPPILHLNHPSRHGTQHNSADLAMGALRNSQNSETWGLADIELAEQRF